MAVSKLFLVADENIDVSMIVVADTAEEARRIVEEYLSERGWTVEQFFGGEPYIDELELKEKEVICIDTGVEW
ncbi:hypothetical protein E3E22_10725 [Thermococcus sp. MV5]|uniref:hypothetical protein n=1 Tax=unclassified Thermococcus TaxID=2627626 RepID=UPI0014397884|nr:MULTISPECIES: hypothetical protein [unclassified Thermococcus]NJE06610.1 hypothetical protein [Thermococcus sp. M36]NJE27073.1 hypothetical protein [Thermococcus sp. MV5]NJE55648.1 hypothetical protein [Thermococcus sp. 21S9]